MDTTKPEHVYRAATDPADRRRIRAAVVDAYRPHVDATVRMVVPARHWEDGYKAGILGLLEALERYQPAPVGAGGVAFWAFASPIVRNVLQQGVDSGLYWRTPAVAEATSIRADWAE